MLVKRPRHNGINETAFLNANPEWADLAYTVLFTREHKPMYGLQHAVAEAMKVAYEMGLNAQKPPWPAHVERRRYEPPPPDPETEQIANEMRLLAWSPLSSSEMPEGWQRWNMTRHLKAKAAKAAAEKSHSALVVVRRRPSQSDTPAEQSAPVLIRRSR